MICLKSVSMRKTFRMLTRKKHRRVVGARKIIRVECQASVVARFEGICLQWSRWTFFETSRSSLSSSSALNLLDSYSTHTQRSFNVSNLNRNRFYFALILPLLQLLFTDSSLAKSFTKKVFSERESVFLCCRELQNR